MNNCVMVQGGSNDGVDWMFPIFRKSRRPLLLSSSIKLFKAILVSWMDFKGVM